QLTGKNYFEFISLTPTKLSLSFEILRNFSIYMKRLVAVTACPTGIAHTLMAAEALKRAAVTMGHEVRVETQGSLGTKEPLTDPEIAAADVLLLAPDIHVAMARFAGNPIHSVST